MPSADMYIDLLAKEEADEGQFVIMVLKWKSGAVVLYRTVDLRVALPVLVNTSAALGMAVSSSSQHALSSG